MSAANKIEPQKVDTRNNSTNNSANSLDSNTMSTQRRYNSKAQRPIYSISRITQMARNRTCDSVDISDKDNSIGRISAENGGNFFRSARNRIRSQSSIISFCNSSQKLRPFESESNEFLKRFAVNGDLKQDPESGVQSLYSSLISGQFVLDPTQASHYNWLALVSLTVCYNIIFVVGRATFWQLHNSCPLIWYTLDYLCDLIYIVDMLANSRTGYLEQGILVRNNQKLAKHYLKSYAFKLDILSLLPTDIAYGFLQIPCTPKQVPCSVIVRLNRLFKFHRLLQFFDNTESATNFPFVFRISKLVLYILVIIHWNACVYFTISYFIGFGSDHWVYQPLSMMGMDGIARNQFANSTVKLETDLLDDDTLVHQYIYCFYWSTLTLTTIGEVPMPEKDIEYLFVVIDFLIGLLIFATIVGNIGSMITNMNAARAEFQNKMDSVKQWMKFRKVNKELEERIIKWFDYLWANRQTLDEDAVTAILPDRLKAETAIHVHLETLRRVQLFQDCEPGLLVQLVLKLKLQVFSPGDYICRVGDVGKEMYIVKRGELSVLSEDCKTVLGTLSDGSVFGELSILNITGVKTGNRRTANVCSVGFSDLFVLSKLDLWNVLEDYPDAKTMLVDKGKQILRKDGLLEDEADTNLSTKQRFIPQTITRSPSLYGLAGDNATMNGALNLTVSGANSTFTPIQSPRATTSTFSYQRNLLQYRNNSSNNLLPKLNEGQRFSQSTGQTLDARSMFKKSLSFAVASLESNRNQTKCQLECRNLNDNIQKQIANQLDIDVQRPRKLQMQSNFSISSDSINPISNNAASSLSLTTGNRDVILPKHSSMTLLYQLIRSNVNTINSKLIELSRSARQAQADILLALNKLSVIEGDIIQLDIEAGQIGDQGMRGATFSSQQLLNCKTNTSLSGNNSDCISANDTAT